MVKKYLAKETKYIVQIIHGAKEHSDRYLEFIQILNQHHISVYIDDLPGHGQYFDQKLKLHDFTLEEIIANVRKVRKAIKTDFPDKKVILFGHSMGSFIAKYLVYNNLEKYDKVILDGTGYVTNIFIFYKILLMKLNPNNHNFNDDLLFRRLRNKSIKYDQTSNWMSYDEKNYQENLNDPLCNHPFTTRSLISMLKIIKYGKTKKVLKKFNNKNLKHLIIFAKADPVPGYGKEIILFYQLLNKYQIKNLKIIMYPNSKHELLFDQEKAQVISDILTFIF